MWATSLSRKYFATEQDIAAIPPVAGTGVDLTNPTGLVGVDRTNRPLEPLTATEVNSFMHEYFRARDMSIGWILLLRVDRSELKVHSDRTRFLRSGNDARIYKNYNVYLPLNKTMSYNGQESGSLETSSALADKKSPMKDVFILDLFAQGSLAPGNLSFRTTATAYWHEK